VAVTAAGHRAAAELAAAWPDEVRVIDRISDRPGDAPSIGAGALVAEAFATCDAVVCFLAVGATVRLIAPLLRDKHTDPAVVCVDEARRFAVPVLGAHAGGGNDLALRVAAVFGATPVVTTASDATGTTALDSLGDLGFTVTGDVAAVGRAILSGELVTLSMDAEWPLPPLPDNVVRSDRSDRSDNSDAPGVSDGAGHSSRSNGPAALDRPMAGAPAIEVSDRLPTAPPLSTKRPSELTTKPLTEGSTEPPTGLATEHLAKAATEATGRIEPSTEPVFPVVRCYPRSLVIGVGSARGVSAEEVGELIDRVLADAALSPLSVRQVATVDLKADEAGILEAARRRGWEVVTHPAADLAATAVPNPSEVVRAEVGTPSVAEAAALRSAGDGAELIVEKVKSANATVAVARARPRGRLAVVGLGPGARDLLTARAVAELRRASVVVGLDQYVAQIRDLLRPGTTVLESGLGDEEERARMAVTEAASGKAVALIGSGDAGVYAMASPALDLLGGFGGVGNGSDGLDSLDDGDRLDSGDNVDGLDGAAVDVVGVPGITAATAASALLGAPLGHDHAYISLSDLHTPWEVIERRVIAAAEGDFTVCFYNPRSRGRDWQLPKALDILAAHRPAHTPVGWVREASREDESVGLATMADFDPSVVDMRTVVIVGSSRSRIVAGRFVTPREYRWR
jgi:cobalt-precorrin 5A hydrolase/precorrin-3B C17-methyltransferase